MTTPADPPTTEMTWLRIEKLAPAIDNLRTTINEKSEAFKMLAASVKSDGVLVPLTVTPRGDTFLIVAGHRRYRAAQLAGLETVPCVVSTMTEAERVITMIVENLARVDLDPVEEANGYFMAIGLGMNQKDLAGRVGRTAAHVARRLALLELPPEVQKRVSEGEVTLEAAAELAKVVKTGALAEADVAQIADERDVAWAAKKLLRDREIETKIAARIEKLTRQGVVAIADTSSHSYERRNDGWKVVGDGYGGIKLDKKAHSKELCNVVVVGNSYNGISEHQFCKDPKRHNKAGASSLKVERPKPSDAEQARNARDKERSDAKRAAVRSVVDGARKWGPLPAEQLEALAMLIFKKLEYNTHEAVCKVLEIEADVTSYTTYGGNKATRKVWDAPLARWLDADRKGRALKLLWAWLLIGYSVPLQTLVDLGGYELDEYEKRTAQWETPDIVESDEDAGDKGDPESDIGDGE